VGNINGGSDGCGISIVEVGPCLFRASGKEFVVVVVIVIEVTVGVLTRAFGTGLGVGCSGGVRDSGSFSLGLGCSGGGSSDAGFSFVERFSGPSEGVLTKELNETLCNVGQVYIGMPMHT